MAITKTDTGRVVLANAEYIHVTPYVDEDTLGTQTYDIVDIVADTLSFTPDDNTINAKDGEFKDDALFENVILGKYQFAMYMLPLVTRISMHLLRLVSATKM